MKKSMITLIIAMMILSLSLFAENSFNDTMNKITVEYLKIKDSLASDKIEMVRENSKVILELAKRLEVNDVMDDNKDHFQKLPAKISIAAEALSKAVDIKTMRSVFKELSKPMAMWATMVKPSGINVAYCSMAPGSWLQTGDEIRNPYYGFSMLKCGEIVSVGEEKKDHHVCDESCDHSK